MTGSNPVNMIRRSRRAARGRRGVTALIAMLFLLLITTLTLAMFHVAGSNVQTSANFSDLSRAQAAAESGLRWTSYRFATMPRPREMAGKITAAVALDVWNRPDGLRARLETNMELARDQRNQPIGVNAEGDSVWTTTQVPTDIQGATFGVIVRQLGPADGADARTLRVTSTGKYRKAVRTISMDFAIEKRAKFAVVGKVPLQFGRNTVVQGPIGMTTPGRYPPILVLSDFTHFHDGLKTKVLAFQAYLKGSGSYGGRPVKNHDGFDGRISTNNLVEFTLATNAGYRDVNQDSYIDEYDLFLATFDTDKDGGVSKAEFTKADGTLYDANLFNAMDSLSPPQYTEDLNNNDRLDPGEDEDNDGELDEELPRRGYQDGVINDRDGYTKFMGQVFLAASATDWQRDINSRTPGQLINDSVAGPIAPTETGQTTIKFNANANDLLDLDPANFEQAAETLRNNTGPAMGPVVRLPGRIENTILLPSDTQYSTIPHTRVTNAGQTTLIVGEYYPTTQFNAANAAATAARRTPATGTAVGATTDERTPFQSNSHQATYRRPAFLGIAFKNVRIPKGMNALFCMCTFSGVTFVEMERNITNSSGVTTYNKDEARSWSQKMKTGSFSPDTALTLSNSYGFEKGNNLRFHNTTFEGPIAGNYATAYSHFTNSWEFTGATMFDNKWIDPISNETTATIIAPQTNIEMGSFTNPNAAPSTLLGVVVAGNIDIRGTSVVDGSILVTGDGAGNTTLGYFGNDDGQTNSGEMPPVNGIRPGYGRLSIYYNPYRALPHGINIPVELRALINTYREGTLWEGAK